MDFTLA
jgi:hypothetical protein